MRTNDRVLVIKRLSLALLGVAAVAAFAFVLVASDDAGVIVEMEWTVDDSCPDAVIIGAAGSGQRDDVFGVGPQIGSAVSGFTTRLEEEASSSVRVGFMALDYPAPGVLEGGLFGFLGDSMFDSISQGRETLKSMIATIGEPCQGSVIYLIGYSQGASVVHTAVAEIPGAQQGAIGGVVVFSDPNRDADDPNVQHFTTEPDPALIGIDTPHTRDGVFTGIASPSWVDGVFYSVCARRDSVCNFSVADLLVADTVHTDEIYHGLGPLLGGLLADDLLDRD